MGKLSNLKHNKFVRKRKKEKIGVIGTPLMLCF